MILQPLQSILGAVSSGTAMVGVQVYGAEVNILESEQVVKGFAGEAVVFVVVVVGAFAVVEEADVAGGDEVGGVAGFYE